jgi:dynein heavy chain
VTKISGMEIKMVSYCVQQLWDYVHIVKTNVEDWKTTPWRKIDVENMDIECKKFAKEIRGNY